MYQEKEINMNKDKKKEKNHIEGNLSSEDRSGFCPDVWEITSIHLEFSEC